MKRAEFIIKLRQWGKKLAMFLGAILVIFLLSKIISSIVQITYTPNEMSRQEEIRDYYNTPVFGENKIEDEVVNECTSIIENFVQYGNNKEYEKIFDMLAKDYQEIKMNNIEQLKVYIDRYFDSKKGFSYQNIINGDNFYIYELKIYNDLMLSGDNSYTSGKQNKINFVIHRENEQWKISLDGFITKKDLNLSSQNEYMKFSVLSKEIYYDHVNFNMEIENLTNNRILAIYNEDIEYLLYSRQTEKITRYLDASKVITIQANKVMPGSSNKISIEYNRYTGPSVSLDYRININKIYSYDLADYMEVLFDNPDITNKAKETYSNIYISL